MAQRTFRVAGSQELADLSADAGGGAGGGGCGEGRGEEGGERKVGGGVRVEGVDVDCAVVYCGHFFFRSWGSACLLVGVVRCGVVPLRGELEVGMQSAGGLLRSYCLEAASAGVTDEAGNKDQVERTEKQNRRLQTVPEVVGVLFG